jgi:hypothetical protein
MNSLLSKRAIRGASVALASAAAMFGAKNAAAATDCAALPKATYVTGSSAVKPFMASLGKALAGSTTIVYKGQGSCVGVDAVLNGTKITGTASYWDAAGMEQTCNLTAAGDVADIGVSDVFGTTCPGIASIPATVGDFFGPNQVMNFIVPAASSQVSISAEAGYFVFGFGAAAGQVKPWTVDANVFIRTPTSGTQAMIAKALNIPSDKMKGTSESKSGDLLTAVATSADPESTIGILASDLADANRDKVKILAYQHYKQACGYLPDSTSSAFDKINVRDGHYPVWGPLHMFTKVDAQKNPVNPEAANLIQVIQGKKAIANANILDIAIGAHTVPSCAMQVQRSTELGDLSAYSPDQSCGCYFEKTANGMTSCKACKADPDCTGAEKHCNFGYCEAK